MTCGVSLLHFIYKQFIYKQLIQFSMSVEVRKRGITPTLYTRLRNDL